MSRLFPRLLPHVAATRHEELNGRDIGYLAEQAQTADDSAVFVATGGARVTSMELAGFRADIRALAEDCGFPGAATQEARNAFDLQAARYMHQEFGMVPAEAASGDVWAFLALVLLPDVAYWRYPDPPKDRVLGTDMTRHVFGRLWWRAHLVYLAGHPDPYAGLEMIGGEAFGQIYERRAALGASPTVVRGILLVWNELDKSKRSRAVLRDYLKRLLRLRAFVSFEAHSEAGLSKTLRSVLNETLIALHGQDETKAQESVEADRNASPEPQGRDRARILGLLEAGPVSLADLAYRCEADRSDIDATLQGLVQEGVVQRLPNRGPHVYGLFDRQQPDRG
ncbi:hypothetical protein L618_002200000630 [Rhodococcus rhodochrous J45]|uniref:Uncharacterized protein n=1 Tax=Rhodococcus rhodochrous J45 TaxID=935266 RepID=A0A562E4K2_RHORH|nr:DUF6339 family protein [Rhodococcus rhodochrous]TWH16653.1 hypothetical protein L618_002200000630 [Rhodococcus rhodochrous J45]